MSFNEYYKKWKKDNNINDNVNNNTQSTPNKQSSFSNYYEQWRENNNVTHKTQSSFSKYYENWKTNKERQQSKNEEVNDEPKENVINQMLFLSPEKQKELEEKLAQFKNQSQSVNSNQKEITNRTADNKIEVPKVQIANKQYEEQKQNKQVESIDKLVKDYKAKEKAEEINKNIQKGGADAVNATLENTVNNFSEGILGAIAGIANVPIMLGAGAIDGVEKIIPNSNSDIKNSLLNESNRIGNKFTKYTNANPYIKNDVIKTIGNISNTIGNMVPSIVSNIFLPGSGTVAQGLSVGGKTAQDSVNNEKDNIGQSIIKGAGYGTASGAIEKLTGGNILGKGSLDDFATNFIGNKISSKLGQKMASKGYEFLGENLEEFLENQVDHAIDYALEGKKVSKEEWINEFNETNKNTILTTAVLNMLGLGGNTYQEIQNNPNIDQNTKQAVKEVNEAIEKNDLGGSKQLEQFINNKLENNSPNLQQQSTQSEQILPTQQITQEQNNIAQNGNMEQNIANNQENSNKSSFSYDKINSKIDSKSNINKLTNNGIIMTYVHMNNQNTQNYGATYGQNIEPAGQYMNVDTMQGKYKVPGAEYGTIQFNNPLVLDHINTGETGWKKTLSDMFDNKTGKELSDAIKRGGYDGIITIDEDGYYNEVVNLSGKKLDSIANNQELDESSSINLAKNETIQEEKFPTRHEIIQENRETARENIKNISTWKDKKSGIRYQLETMERNMYDIIPDKAEAKKINDTYFEPIHTSEAEKQKFINNYNDRIRQFDLNKYESEAVQFLGEKKYNPDFYKGSQEDISARNEIASKINKNIENGKIDQEKVNNAIEEFRKIYDELFELENNTLRENGYKEKPYRKGYFPHFVDYVPETKTEKVLNKLGFKIDKRPLPTDIAGITEQFVPGKTWNRSALERKGNKTDYNALKGFDTYIAQASDNIFHTENIQRLRGLENEIRYQYSDKGVQERIDNILNDETLFEEEKQAMIDGILEQVENPMPNLVTELRRYTNALANKKSEADRSIENMIGRPIYSTVNAIENRFGANAVGLNIGSAITNFIPITQAYSQVSTKNMGRAIIDTVKSYANNDGFVDKSVFLTSRLNQSEKLYKTSLEKISDKTSFLFNAIDEVTSNIVVRGKYLENIQNGMSEAEAIKNADQFARNVIADRSKGALPTKFEEKNPVTKMFTQFQLEVNNQYRYMFKDLPRDLAEKGLAGIALAFFKMFVGAWVYNEASEKITGRKPAFSPIDLVSSSYKTITDKDMKTYDKVASIGTDIAEQLPFVGGLVGGGRIPVNGAIPDVGNLTKAGIGLATGEMDSNRAMNTIGKELSKPLYYLLPPFGGGQIKKSVEGIQTVAQGGSYGVDNKGEKTLQFPVENPNAGDYIKAGLFGKYALPKAKEYVDGDFKSLSAKDTKLYKNSKIDYGILKKYIADRDEKVNNKAKSQETKIKIIKNLPVSTDQKWEIYKSDIFSTTERKDGTTEKEEYEKLLKQGFSKSTLIQWYDINKIESKKDEEGKAIEGSSQGQKALAIMKMNVSDDQKNKMLSLITTSKNPETVNTLSRLEKSEQAYTDYFALNKSDTFFQTKISRDDMQDIQDLGINQDEFMKFAENISNINSEKDANGKTISGSKKKAVANYINSLNLSSGEKAILFAKAGYPDNSYKQAIYNYINGLNLSATRKKEIWDSLGYK